MDEPGKQGESKKQNTGMAVLAYILFFIPLLTDAKNDPFVKYHVKQGLTLFIGYIVEMFIGAIPVIGWMISSLLGILLFVLFIMGVMNAVNGKEQPLPIIGKFAEGLNI